MAGGKNSGFRTLAYTGLAIGATALVGWGVLKPALDFAKLKSNLVILTKAKSISKGQIIVTTTFQNRVSRSVKIKYPSAVIKYKGKEVSTSNPQDQLVNIPANGTVSIDIALDFNLINLATSLPDLVALLLAKQSPSLDVTVYSGLSTALAGDIEYTKTDTIKFTSI